MRPRSIHRPAARAFLALAVVVPFMGCRGPKRDREVEVVVTRPKGETGNMHYAERVVIRAGRGRAVVIKTDMEKGLLAPLIEKQLGTGPKRALLLGWTSWGGGMLTVHALLVERTDAGVVLRDRLEITSDRASVGVFVTPKGAKSRIGIPEPDEEAHHAPDWALRFGGRTLDLKAIRALPYTAENLPRDALHYRPPFRKRKLPPRSRVVWFTIEKGKFQPPPKQHGK